MVTEQSSGFLALGTLLSAFPGIYPSGLVKSTHPITVAGPLRILTGFPVLDSYYRTMSVFKEQFMNLPRIILTLNPINDKSEFFLLSTFLKIPPGDYLTLVFVYYLFVCLLLPGNIMCRPFLIFIFQDPFGYLFCISQVIHSVISSITDEFPG